MLHLDTRLVGHAVAAGLLSATQSQVAQHARQGGIADFDLLLFDQLLVNPLDPSVALAIQTLQQLGVNVLLVAPVSASEHSLLLDNPPHRIAADMQPATDLAL